MNSGIFVTGTDTDCGKTRVSVALIERLRQRGVRVGGFKPVAAGARWCDGQLRNDDALALGKAADLGVDYRLINPYCFESPIAPHLAAHRTGQAIGLAPILAARDALSAACDFLVTEAAGGWRVPLGPGLDIEGLALELRLPVLLVVGLRLGCLNHALLTALSIRSSGAALIGWVGSHVDPAMSHLNENILTLEKELPVPCLGVLRHPMSSAPADRDRPLLLDQLTGDAGTS